MEDSLWDYDLGWSCCWPQLPKGLGTAYHDADHGATEEDINWPFRESYHSEHVLASRADI